MQKMILISNHPQCQIEIQQNIEITETLRSPKEAIHFLEQNEDVSVIIVEHPSQQEDVQELIDFINHRNNYVFSIAVLILTDDSTMEEDCRFLGGAVVDCIEKPFHPAVIQNRIQNAETLINSVSFAEFARMLKVLPANIYLKDANGKYVFSSQTWHHLDTAGDPSWSIRGKTDLDIRKDKENARLAMESDKEIIRTGIGTSYIIEENDEEQEFLQLIKEPLFFEDGRVRGIIALINNVTEQELMRRKLKEQSIHDTLTGVYNRTYLDEYIQELRQKNQYPISVISADCDNLKYINDTYGHMAGDKYICFCVELMQKTLPSKSSIFRTGGDEFVIFLPQTSADETMILIEKMKQGASAYTLKNYPLSVSFGYAVASDENESIVKLIKVSDNDMYQDKRKKKNKR